MMAIVPLQREFDSQPLDADVVKSRRVGVDPGVPVLSAMSRGRKGSRSFLLFSQLHQGKLAYLTSYGKGRSSVMVFKSLSTAKTRLWKSSLMPDIFPRGW